MMALNDFCCTEEALFHQNRGRRHCLQPTIVKRTELTDFDNNGVRSTPKIQPKNNYICYERSSLSSTRFAAGLFLGCYWCVPLMRPGPSFSPVIKLGGGRTKANEGEDAAKKAAQKEWNSTKIMEMKGHWLRSPPPLPRFMVTFLNLGGFLGGKEIQITQRSKLNKTADLSLSLLFCPQFNLSQVVRTKYPKQRLQKRLLLSTTPVVNPYNEDILTAGVSERNKSIRKQRSSHSLIQRKTLFVEGLSDV